MKIYLSKLKDILTITCSCSCIELHIPFKIIINEDILDVLNLCPKETNRPLKVTYRNPGKITISDTTGLKGGTIDFNNKDNLRENIERLIREVRKNDKEDEESDT